MWRAPDIPLNPAQARQRQPDTCNKYAPHNAFEAERYRRSANESYRHHRKQHYLYIRREWPAQLTPFPGSEGVAIRPWPPRQPMNIV